MAGFRQQPSRLFPSLPASAQPHTPHPVPLPPTQTRCFTHSLCQAAAHGCYGGRRAGCAGHARVNSAHRACCVGCPAVATAVAAAARTCRQASPKTPASRAPSRACFDRGPARSMHLPAVPAQLPMASPLTKPLTKLPVRVETPRPALAQDPPCLRSDSKQLCCWLRVVPSSLEGSTPTQADPSMTSAHVPPRTEHSPTNQTNPILARPRRHPKTPLDLSNCPDVFAKRVQTEGPRHGMAGSYEEKHVQWGAHKRRHGGGQHAAAPMSTGPYPLCLICCLPLDAQQASLAAESAGTQPRGL